MKIVNYCFIGHYGVLGEEIIGDPPGSPVLEINNRSLVLSKVPDFVETLDHIKPTIALVYKDCPGSYGSRGDLIDVTVIESEGYWIYVNFIAKIVDPKPTLAADILPFVIDSRRKVYFIGITRKYEPGKGKLALIGGKQDCIDGRFEAPFETAIREAGEEVNGLRIRALHSYSDLRTHYLLQRPSYDVFVDFGSAITGITLGVKAKLQLLGTFQTSNQEKITGSNRRRVDWTTAYLLPIHLGEQVVEKQDLERWLKADDDAESLQIIEWGVDEFPEFGLSHHDDIYHQAYKIIRKKFISFAQVEK